MASVLPSDAALWVYARGDDSVTVEVREAANTLHLRIAGPSHTRASFEFSDWPALIAHQSRYEAQLLAQGFSLLRFNRDRRGGHDRRGWPRRNDRERRRP